MRINDVLNEGLPGGEYSRVLTALKMYYPDKFSMQELNTPEWHRVIANKADVPMEYAGDVIDGFVKASQRNDDDDYNDEQGVAEGSGDVGNTIRQLYQQFYDQGDDALEYLNTHAPLFAQFWDQYEGDLDSIIAEVSPKNLIRIAQELKQIAGEQGVAEGDLNEFVPAGRGPGDDDEEPGDDPYKSPKPEAYGRSIDFFGRFEADHFDKEHMDDATGVFKGYWDYDGDMKQIAYFKFDDPARTGSDDPGMGWYYEPQNESVAEGIDDEEYGPELAALKKEFGKFTQHYDRMDQDSAYAAQWRKQNTDRLNREVPDDEDMMGDISAEMGQDDEDIMRETKPKEKEADYGADYQDMVSRVKKLAGLGPLKTVYDPQKRVYKNVPTAVQPKKEQR